MGVDRFPSPFAAVQTSWYSAFRRRAPVGRGPTLESAGRRPSVARPSRGGAAVRPSPPTSCDAPPRTGGLVWGSIPRGNSPPPPCKMAATAAHVTGAPAPPAEGRAEAGPRLPGAPFGLRGLGRGAGLSGEPRGRTHAVLRARPGEVRVAAFHCPGSNLLDTCVTFGQEWFCFLLLWSILNAHKVELISFSIRISVLTWNSVSGSFKTCIRYLICSTFSFKIFCKKLVESVL